MGKLLLLLALTFIALPITVSASPATPGDSTVIGLSKEPAPPEKTEPIKFALTFDDGPDPTYTPQVLALLNKFGARATFFMLGSKSPQYPDLVKQVAASGNEIGSHSMTHTDPKLLSASQLDYEITKSVTLLRKQSGQSIHFFRPPYGENTPIYSRRSARLGVKIVTWTIDSKDWSGISSDIIADGVLAKLEPGCIVLLHDGVENSRQTVAAVEVILREAAARGYKSVTLSELGI